MNKKPIKLRIRSKQFGLTGEKDEAESFDMTTDATLCENGGNVVIEYDEKLSAEDGVTHTSLSFDRNKPETVFLSRLGGARMTCVLEEKQRYRFLYDVGFAAIELVAVGHSVKNRISEDGGDMCLRYDMESRGIVMRHCDFKMTIVNK